MKPQIQISTITEGDVRRVIVEVRLRVGEKVAFKPSEFGQRWDQTFYLRAFSADSDHEIQFQSPHWTFTPNPTKEKHTVEGTLSCNSPADKIPFEIRLNKIE